MRIIFSVLVFCISSLSLLAKDGYTIVAKVKNNQSPKAYLAFYYGKQSNVLKKDSADYDSIKQTFTFHRDKKITGGIYLLVFADRTGNIEFLLDNGAELDFSFDKKNIISSAVFKDKENKAFYEYQRYVESLEPAFATQMQALAKCTTRADSIIVGDKIQILNDSIAAFRNRYSNKYKGSLGATIFNAMWEPTLPNIFPKDSITGKVDSFYRYRYVRQHYWDNFPWGDDRIINTPVYDKRLEDYLKRVPPIPDSLNKEIDFLLSKHGEAKDMFKYTLWYLSRYTEASKIMGLDESFVYIVENYYQKGKAFWLNDSQVNKYVERAAAIKPSIIGNTAPQLVVPDIEGKVVRFGDIFKKKKYTLLAFYSADCGHCMKEIPQLDSTVQKLLPNYDLQIIGFHTENVGEKWRSFLKQHNLYQPHWVHVHDPTGTSNFPSLYDILATPSIFLIDQDGILRGKKLDHKNITGLLEFLEKKRKNQAQNK